MATYSALPATLNLVATIGNDFTLSLTVTENGSPWVATGATLATDIIDSSGAVVATDFTTAASTGTVSLSLTDTNTTTLGVGVYSYRLSVTKSSLTRDWIAGTLSIVEAGQGGTSTSSASLAISNSAVSLSLTSLVAPLAENISVSDQAGNFTGDDVEEVLAEIDDRIDAHLADTVDAHDASAISVADAGGYYTGTTVEAVLAEQGLQRTRDLLYPVQVQPIKIMSSPPTVGAFTTTTAIGSPQYFYTSSGVTTPTASVNTAFFTTAVGADWVRLGDTFPNYNYVYSVLPSTGAGSAYTRVEFDHDGSAFEVMFKGQSGSLRMWVNGELVATAATAISNTGSTYFMPVSFGSTSRRRITIDAYNWSFGGVVVGPNDSVASVEARRPKVLLFGDSFAEGTGASNCDGFPVILGQMLGWDVWAAAQGGSGYSAPGSYTGKYSTRVSMYAAMDFDVVITSCGINDANATYAASIAADAASLFSTIKATWPNAVWICTSPLVNKGVEGWPSQYHSARADLRSAAVAAGFHYADVMEMPISGSTPATGTLSNSPAAGATTFTCSFRPPIGSTVEIGTGLSTVERRRVTNTSGGGAPYTLTVAALTSSHTSGETVRQVGNSLWTGTGRVGATTGTGNCDLYVSSDGTHPTAAGHLAIGQALAEQIASILNPY